MTTTAHPARARWRVLLLAALTVVLAWLLPAVPVSAAALPAAETRVGASDPATAEVVGVHECITAGQRPVRGPSQLQIVVGNCVAAEAGPGAWGAASESMSARAAGYQARITGAADGSVYRVGGVKFDGFSNGVLQEAKGPGYANFVKNGQFQPWYNGADSLASQAQRQLSAAGGSPIRWSVAESDAVTAINNLFGQRGISGINVVWTP